ncbi:putative ABC transporter ATP-binding protein YxlF [Planctomycetes bacterium Pla163]|uniref:Putative ABC transporter ATP-binding protein YxlF n=1 Tax=Rohdeia mirabilis TaxID=2528008 RepID=A0A518CZW8_9BACT|nr:putative ABC transporter ATP-binding protein YxlF [Planctomycetes bacterium Pla163]
MIEVQNLTRRFGPHVAVDDLSFRLEAGEVVGFLGPNGAGKTTTMRMLAGFLPATRGRITIGGFDVLRQSLEVRRRIGYLPENVPLYPELRVEEMLRFQARLHRIPRGERVERIGRALERVGLTDRARSLVGALSRGLRQRAGLAVSLLPEPDVLILDEPTSGLDPIQRMEVRRLVQDLASEHTVLLSSHILAEVEAICPRVLIVHRGRCLADGRAEDLVRELGGGAAFVRVEAAVPDASDAARLLGSLPGVESVEVGERLGIHTEFVVRGDGDLREDVGALAMAKSWALRELSWEKPSLERLFAALVLGEEPASAALGTSAERAGGAQPERAAASAAPQGLLALAPDSGAGGQRNVPPTMAANTSGPKAASNVLDPFARAKPPAAPTLNPFERATPAAPPPPDVEAERAEGDPS